jgi:hypothetical protein
MPPGSLVSHKTCPSSFEIAATVLLSPSKRMSSEFIEFREWFSIGICIHGNRATGHSASSVSQSQSRTFPGGELLQIRAAVGVLTSFLFSSRYPRSGRDHKRICSRQTIQIALPRRAVAFTLSCNVNEPRPLSDSKLCPICRAKVPFSLALHMIAAHSPEAKERSAKALDDTLPNYQVSAHKQAWSEPPSNSRRPNPAHRDKSGFARNRGKRRH